MRSYRKEIWMNIPSRRAFVNITSQVEDAVHESGVKEGLVLVNAMHISASVFINDDESGLHSDYERWLEKLAPHEPVSQYRHNDTGEDNADAHMKRQVMGREVVAAIDAATQEARGYLAAYDRDTIFAQEDSARNVLLLTFVKDIAIWHLINLCNAGTDRTLRQDRYERAISWLKGVMKGDITPDLPKLETSSDNPGIISYGSNPKRSQHF